MSQNIKIVALRTIGYLAIISGILFVISIPAIFFFPKAWLPFPVAIPLALFFFLLYCIFYYLLMNTKDRIEYQMSALERSKSGFLKVKVDPSFKKVAGEKVIIPLTACYIKAAVVASYNEFPRYIIVTNKRILIGLRTAVFAYQTETFGDFNIWAPSTKLIPSPKSQYSDLRDLLGGNQKMKSISYSPQMPGQGEPEYVEIKLDAVGFLSATFKLYHRQAKQIYRIFSQKNKNKK